MHVHYIDIRGYEVIVSFKLIRYFMIVHHPAFGCWALQAYIPNTPLQSYTVIYRAKDRESCSKVLSRLIEEYSKGVLETYLVDDLAITQKGTKDGDNVRRETSGRDSTTSEDANDVVG